MFKKTYWFSSPKGYFRVLITENDVLMEAKPNHYVSSKDLFPTRPDFLKTRNLNERRKIMETHLQEYNEMINILNNFKTVEEQDEYIKTELAKQGYWFIK